MNLLAPGVVAASLALVAAALLAGCAEGLDRDDRDDDRDDDDRVALPVHESFEGGAEGAAVTPENSLFTVVLNDPATFEQRPDPVDGQFVGRYATPGLDIRTKIELDLPNRPAHLVGRVYLWLDSYPGDEMRFLTFETSPEVDPPGEDALALRMDEAGAVTVYDGVSFQPENRTADPLPLHEWVRLEVEYDASAGAHGRSELRVLTASQLAGQPPGETVTVDHLAEPGHPVTTAAFGVLNHVSADFSLDAIEVTSGLAAATQPQLIDSQSRRGSRSVRLAKARSAPVPQITRLSIPGPA